MPRKKREATDLDAEIDLVTEDQFEDAMRAVLGASNKRVADRMEEMQASNRRRRQDRKPKVEKP